MIEFLKKNVDCIVCNVSSTILAALILGIPPFAFWIVWEYSHMKYKIEEHDTKLITLQQNIFNILQSGFEENKLINDKINSEKLAKVVVESKISPQVLSSTLNIIGKNDIPVARCMIKKQGLLDSHQLNQIFKSDNTMPELNAQTKSSERGGS